MSFARNLYRQAATPGPEAAQDPHDVVFITLRELTRSLAVLEVAQKQEMAYPSEHLNRGLTALYILQSSLDFEAGGEIASDLFQLYEFARFHVLRAWRGEPDARLSDALTAMRNIQEAWEGIRPDAKIPA